MEKGFPTHTKDVNGEVIKLGDICFYDFEDDEPPSYFEVVFEDNAFRKKYRRWEKGLLKPFLGTQAEINEMRITIKK